nr:unnamed protein product [Digitaria exilis]
MIQTAHKPLLPCDSLLSYPAPSSSIRQIQPIGAMALRNLTSKVGIPALRRASGPLVRHLTSGSYQVRVGSSTTKPQLYERAS